MPAGQIELHAAGVREAGVDAAAETARCLLGGSASSRMLRTSASIERP